MIPTVFADGRLGRWSSMVLVFVLTNRPKYQHRGSEQQAGMAFPVLRTGDWGEAPAGDSSARSWAHSHTCAQLTGELGRVASSEGLLSGPCGRSGCSRVTCSQPARLYETSSSRGLQLTVSLPEPTIGQSKSQGAWIQEEISSLPSLSLTFF